MLKQALTVKENEQLALLAKQELSRRYFLDFITYTKKNYIVKPIHKKICSEIDNFIQSNTYRKLMIFLQPQSGKSEISTRRLAPYLFGINPNIKIGITSYNSIIASKFNREIQRIIDDEKYINLFPDIKLQGMKMNSAVSVNSIRTSTEFEIIGYDGSLVTVGVGGGLTSRQIDFLIIDDVYKDAMEAWSPLIRENVWDWFLSVASTRLHNNSKILIVFTRWHQDDLAGKLLKQEPEEWKVLRFPAIATCDEDIRKKGEVLWPERHSLKELLKIKKKSPQIFGSLYQQNPKPKEGLLYQDLKEYKKIPAGWEATMYNQIDVADKGENYLCSIFYRLFENYVYIVDVVYTQDDNKKTIPLLVRKTIEHEPIVATYESNAAGNIYADQIEERIRKKGQIKTAIVKKNTTDNKEAKILTHVTIVQERILFPQNWSVLFPEFYDEVTGFLKLFKKNKCDDGVDCLSEIAKKLNNIVNAEIYEDQNKDEFFDDNDDYVDDDDW